MSSPSIDPSADRAAQPVDRVTTPRAAYAPPSVTELGGLAELTLGGIDGAVSDGFGTAGDSGPSI